LKESKNIPIKEWAIDDRPREKAQLKGFDAVSDAELLAILMGNGTNNKSALDIAKELLQFYNNNINLLSKDTIKNICKKVKGIGPAKATTILAALELGNRRVIESAIIKERFTSAKYFAALLTPIIGNLQEEHFYCLFLNNNMNLLSYEIISKGSSNSTVVDIKLIARKCIENNATRIVIAHNHPSGSLEPSNEDIKLTARIKQGISLIDVLLTDHLIITNNGFTSLADDGFM
jgi:DNA repair protein RadC